MTAMTATARRSTLGAYDGQVGAWVSSYEAIADDGLGPVSDTMPRLFRAHSTCSRFSFDAPVTSLGRRPLGLRWSAHRGATGPLPWDPPAAPRNLCRARSRI